MHLDCLTLQYYDSNCMSLHHAIMQNIVCYFSFSILSFKCYAHTSISQSAIPDIKIPKLPHISM